MLFVYPDISKSCVGFDNREAADKIALYLLDLCHRRFAVIAGQTENYDRAADRLEEFIEAIDAYKLCTSSRLLKVFYEKGGVDRVAFDGSLAVSVDIHGANPECTIE